MLGVTKEVVVRVAVRVVRVAEECKAAEGEADTQLRCCMCPAVSLGMGTGHLPHQPSGAMARTIHSCCSKLRKVHIQTHRDHREVRRHARTHLQVARQVVEASEVVRTVVWAVAAA